MAAGRLAACATPGIERAGGYRVVGGSGAPGWAGMQIELPGRRPCPGGHCTPGVGSGIPGVELPGTPGVALPGIRGVGLPGIVGVVGPGMLEPGVLGVVGPGMPGVVVPPGVPGPVAGVWAAAGAARSAAKT